MSDEPKKPLLRDVIDDILKVRAHERMIVGDGIFTPAEERTQDEHVLDIHSARMGMNKE